MTMVQPAGAGAEPGDGGLLAPVRTARAPGRGAATRGLPGSAAQKPARADQPARPFEAQLLVAAQDLPDPGDPHGEHRPGPRDWDDRDAEAGPQGSPMVAAAVAIEQLLQVAPSDLGPAGGAGTAQAGAAIGAATAARRGSAGEAAPARGTTAGADGPAKGDPGVTLPVEFTQAMPAAATAAATANAASAPAVASAPGPDNPVAAPIPGSERARDGSSSASRSAGQPARRDSMAMLAPTPSFRLEAAGEPLGAAADVRGGAMPEQGAAPLPADIVVAGAGDAAGLDVTIAAATPDLRDRFRAATDELLAELTAIGTEVDAIHVELRSELADGGSGAGAGEDGRARGDIEQVQAGRGELDAAARIDMAEAQEPEPEADPDSQSAQDPSAGMADGGRERQPGRGAGFDLERLRLVPQATPVRSAVMSGAEAGSGAPGIRVDRYA